MRGEASEIEIIQKGMEKKLFFIPGGSQVSNPSELLLSEKMKQLLDRFTPFFDWIVIDSPPAMPVHDASILADLTDGVLLVVQAGSTNVEIAEKTAAEFQGKNFRKARFLWGILLWVSGRQSLVSEPIVRGHFRPRRT